MKSMQTLAAYVCALSMLGVVATSESYGADPDYVLALPDVEEPVDTIQPIGVMLTSSGDDITAFQFAVCDDSLIDTGFGEIAPGEGLDPLLLDSFLLSFDADSWSVAATLTPGNALDAHEPIEIVVAKYELLKEGESTLEFCAAVLASMITTEGGEEIEPVTDPGLITIVPPLQFLRGDTNGDGRVDALLDAYYLLMWGFDGGDAPPCKEAADISDNGTVNALSDALKLLTRVFSGGAEIPDPGIKTCGKQTGAVDLGCLESAPDCPSDPPVLTTDASVLFSFGATVEILEVGEQMLLPILVTVSGDPIAGFQMGLCHEEGLALVAPAPGVGAVERGAASEDFGFVGVTLLDSGWTVGALTSLTSGGLLESGEYEMFLANYMMMKAGVWDIEFCDVLGDPPIACRAMRDMAFLLPELAAPKLIEVVADLPAFVYSAIAPTVAYDPDELSGGIEFSADLAIRERPEHVGFPSDTIGFTMAVSHDGELLEPTACEAIGALAALNGGAGPSYIAIDLEPGSSAAGVTIDVVYQRAGGVTLAFADESPVIRVDYAVTSAALAGLSTDDDGVMTTLEWRDDMGLPTVINTVKREGGDEIPLLENCSVQIVPADLGPSFLRGDVDGNGTVFALGDALILLRYGFLSGDAPPCMDAADVDDSGVVSAITDAVYLLRWQFSAGDAPPAPGVASCGSDPTLDDTACEIASGSCD